MKTGSQDWNEISKALAFSGNSLLAPMNQTDSCGLDPSFWDVFPTFGDEAVAGAVSRCRAFAEEIRAQGAESDWVRQVSVEYTRLFVGPPSPQAAPWETFYRHEGVSVGFGEATFEMQRLLREAGLQISNDNRQYADHIGIELLYLSVLCDSAANGDQAEAVACKAFAENRPLSWAGKLEQRIADACPDGYYLRITQLAIALLRVVAR